MLVTEERLLDAAGRPRSPATMLGSHAGRPPRNKGSATRPIRPASSDLSGAPRVAITVKRLTSPTGVRRSSDTTG